MESHIALAQYAAKRIKLLMEQSNPANQNVSRSVVIPDPPKQNRPIHLPKFLVENQEQDTTKLAVSILLGTRLVLTGSDSQRVLNFDVNSRLTKDQDRFESKRRRKLYSIPSPPQKSSLTLITSSSSAAAAALEKPYGTTTSTVPGKKRASSSSTSNITKGCKVPGCGKPFALTSSYYCNEHVGSGALCAKENCVRAAEGPEGPKRFCRLHMMEELERVAQLSKASNQQQLLASMTLQIQNPVPVTTRAPVPSDYEPQYKGKRCMFDSCNKSARGASWFCIEHGGGKRCQFRNCSRSARGATSFCVTHGGGRRCSVELCPKSAVGRTNLCIAHGGGRRCEYKDCTHSAEGATSFCIRHGGGRRCRTPDCNKSAVGTTDYCVACGGGRRCTIPGCEKSAVGSTLLCKGHGGGRRCTHPDGCNKSAQGATFLCILHGGGKRCSFVGCTRSVQGLGSLCKLHEADEEE